MKIKAKDIKPGMLIVRKYNGKYTNDYELVAAVKGLVEVEVTHFNSMDSYSGRMVCFIDGKERVKVITKKKKRARIIKNILNDIFKRLHDTENDVDIIRLIQSMER